jgi:tetratricopeptide (TPR) repeat protein
MTTPNAAPREANPAGYRLPWWIAGGALLFFFATLNHWISLNSLGTVARLLGWAWRPEIGQPLTLVVFAPFRLLPESWLPLALNVATAICAALVLVQLARSVAILRYDIAPADPMRKKNSGPLLLTGSLAWVPPVFAALACGLQLGFWEHATAASGEMLSLLCFACALRCLLEFRLDPQQKWLSRCVLVFAVGMTDNWLMVGYLPVLVAGIIWVKGYTPCLNLRFQGRMAFWALLGLSLYLLIPIWLSVTAPDQWEFWPALKAQLAAQKNALQVFRVPAFRLLAVTALLPFLLLAVRWRSHTMQLADDTRFGVFFTKATGHFIHGLFFITALWIVFNPAFIPRQAELKSPLLLYHYPWAMVAGYGAGYLLLFGAPRESRRQAKWPALATLGLLVVLPAILIWKNYGDIRLTNGRALREFARQLYEDLPAGKVTVLSDESRPLLLLRVELAAQGREKNPLLVDTRALPWPEYHRRMARDFGARWQNVLPTNRVASIGPERLLALVRHIATNEPVVYLHPSSGFFLEDFAAAPQGWIQRLGERSPDRVGGSHRATTTATEELWQRRWTTQLAARVAQFEASRQRVARGSHPVLKSLRLGSQANETATMLAGAYAKALNHWGVQMARAGQDAEAGIWYQRALAFNPDNLAARINWESQARRQRGESPRVTLAWVQATHPRLLAQFQAWPEVISRNGPVDEPTFLLHTGRMYLAAENPQQALEAFTRTAVLAPDWAAPRLWQAQTQNRLGNFAAALALTEDLPAVAKAHEKLAWAQLLQVRTVALRRSGRPHAAAAYLDQFASAHEDDTEVIVAAAELCGQAGQYQAELKWRALLQEREPNRVDWLVNKGHAELRAEQFEAALATLTRALTLKPAADNARLFRALAAMQTGQLEAAKRDFRALLPHREHGPGAMFGLGNIAWHERDTNTMVQFYQMFLSNNPPAPQAAVATQRLDTWRNE